jgi:hypothetical protein
MEKDGIILRIQKYIVSSQHQSLMNMKYPIGIQNFESLIQDGYVYVDKTALIYQLADTGRYYFLSRPRRFGKSLLISTMDAYFSGKRELFKGLAIDKLEQKWTQYPILHLDLNTAKYDTKESLDEVLNMKLLEWESVYGVGAGETSLSLRFLGIVKRACEKTGERVVILVDEYDKPMLQAINDENLTKEYQKTLKAFYSVLKTQDGYIKFAFLTGVTKLTYGRSCSRSTENASTLCSHSNATFGKVSVFSDLNNLKDISMVSRYIDICGITEKELHTYFDTSAGELAEAEGIDKETCYDKLKEQYDGYHFMEHSIGIYNPFSVLNTFDNKCFRDYWFETGTPSYLVQLLKNADYELPDLTQEHITADVLNSIDSMSQNPIPVIYQSGYLTIKDYDPRFRMYELGFPNKEVENGFMNYLLPYYTPIKKTDTAFFVASFVEDVEKGRPEEFMKRMSTMFSRTDYKIVGDAELYFQNAFYLIITMMGFYTDVERTTSEGRIDMTVETKDYIYIFEFKLDGTPEEALRQIEEKGYAKPFAMDPRRLYRIGVNFSSEKRGIDEWKIE